MALGGPGPAQPQAPTCAPAACAELAGVGGGTPGQRAHPRRGAPGPPSHPGAGARSGPAPGTSQRRRPGRAEPRPRLQIGLPAPPARPRRLPREALPAPRPAPGGVRGPPSPGAPPGAPCPGRRRHSGRPIPSLGSRRSAGLAVRGLIGRSPLGRGGDAGEGCCAQLLFLLLPSLIQLLTEKGGSAAALCHALTVICLKRIKSQLPAIRFA